MVEASGLPALGRVLTFAKRNAFFDNIVPGSTVDRASSTLI